jgi:uncharacterized protein YukJ
MSLPYGFVKTKILSIEPKLRPLERAHETQYHLHATLAMEGGNWDVAINVGTDQDNDLLKYKLVTDFTHSITSTLASANPGQVKLDRQELPALDFYRSDILTNTGSWIESERMDGSNTPQPVASLRPLLEKARDEQRDTYIFGRFYAQGGGVHDTHMNQGSRKGFINKPDDPSNDRKDHNDIWQDGAVIVQITDTQWIAYFAAFDQQWLPTDDDGNPEPGSKSVSFFPSGGAS